MVATDVYGIIATASNIRSGDNPEYTKEQFLTMYPQFGSVPDIVLRAWLKLAHSCVRFARWGDLWEMGMGLFIAHFLTLYLQAATPEGAKNQEIISAGLAKGITSSKSVADMSVSYDFGSVANEFAGWGTLAQTSYGQQLAGFAKLVSMGGMTIW